MTFVSTPQPLVYAFQYGELQAVEEHPVSVIEVLNTKKEWNIITVTYLMGSSPQSSSLPTYRSAWRLYNTF